MLPANASLTVQTAAATQAVEADNLISVTWLQTHLLPVAELFQIMQPPSVQELMLSNYIEHVISGLLGAEFVNSVLLL